MVIVDASDGPMFVKKVLNIFAISFLSVIILPSNLSLVIVFYLLFCLSLL